MPGRDGSISSGDLLDGKTKHQDFENLARASDQALAALRCGCTERRAFIYYFTHPGRSKANPAAKDLLTITSVIQLAELNM